MFSYFELSAVQAKRAMNNGPACCEISPAYNNIIYDAPYACLSLLEYNCAICKDIALKYFIFIIMVQKYSMLAVYCVCISICLLKYRSPIYDAKHINLYCAWDKQYKMT